MLHGKGNETEEVDASSCLTLVALFAIQMGEHTNSTFLSPRILTLTASLLTLILFGYYANDITADMTSGVKRVLSNVDISQFV